MAVHAIRVDGSLQANGSSARYDLVVNATGPWAEDLLKRSGISSAHTLDLVRGSHLVLTSSAAHAFLVEVPDEDRLCFILPYQGRTLLGTTEVRQSLDEPIECTPAEQSYLLRVYNQYIRPT
jgi:glycerol-3-phosphate dehydrogenase